MCLLSFGWDLSPKFVPQDLQILLIITARVERKIRFCEKLFDFFPRRIIIRLTWNLLRFVPNSVEILTWNFRRIFQKFCANQRYPLPNLVKFRPTFYNFILGLYCVEKFTQVFSYVSCTQLRRHVHKQITKRGYGEENPGHFVFRKLVLFTLGSGLTTPYSLGILVWHFYQTFVIVPIEFWLRFEPQIHPTRFAINFLFIIARAERKVRLCVKLFGFFPRRIFIRLSWNLLQFVPNSGKILTWNFREKLFQENFS